MPTRSMAILLLLSLGSVASAQGLHRLAWSVSRPASTGATPGCDCVMLHAPAVRGAQRPSRVWPAGIVPYTFGSSVSLPNQQRARDAMDELEAVAPVRFVERSDEPDYIRLENSDQNASFVGRVGGAQVVYVFNWTYRYIIVHELMHALGMYHEQSRPDRDQYVRINSQNIRPGTEINFQIASDAAVHGPYDFESVMHYNQTAFSSNGQPTITALPGYEQHQWSMGQTSYISAGDGASLQDLYGFVANGPTAHDDEIAVSGNQTSLLSELLLLANDDGNGSPLAMASVGGATAGTVERGANGLITYTPPLGFVGSDTFTYSLEGDIGHGTAEVTLDVLPAPRTWYVDAAAAGARDGSTWSNAFDTLGAALGAVDAGDVIWIAEGVYVPGTGRDASFVVPDGVRLLGGFPAGGGDGTIAARDAFGHVRETVLSGATAGGSAYHVVRIEDAAQRVELDGLVIRGGVADGAAGRDRGAGVLVDNSDDVVFKGCCIVENEASGDGAGVHALDSNLRVIASRFRSNRCDDDGAGLLCQGGTLSLESCVFDGNLAGDLAGAVYVLGNAEARLLGCTVVDNMAADRGGALFANGPTVVEMRNCILWGNGAGDSGPELALINGAVATVSYSLVAGGEQAVEIAGGGVEWRNGNRDENPILADRLGPDGIAGTGDELLVLRAGSPLIDAGENAGLEPDVWLDASGMPRRVDAAMYADTGAGLGAIVDLGAYEASVQTPEAPLATVQIRLVRSDDEAFHANDTGPIEVATESPSVTGYVQARLVGDDIATGVVTFDGVLTSDGGGVFEAAPLTNTEAVGFAVPGLDVRGRTGLFPSYRATVGLANDDPGNGVQFDGAWRILPLNIEPAGNGEGLDSWANVYKFRWSADGPALPEVTIEAGAALGGYQSLLGLRQPAPVTPGTMRLVSVPRCLCDRVWPDDQLNVLDLLDFIDAWLGARGAAVVPGSGADFDGSGTVGITDLLVYLDCWLGGCV